VIAHGVEKRRRRRRLAMKAGEKLVVIGCGGVGGPASVLSKKLMPEVEVTNIREEDRFIVR
jgi:D-arabinose 1-dehydrogenase-like Zn-dependent alcohol dehydrogenase